MNLLDPHPAPHPPRPSHLSFHGTASSRLGAVLALAASLTLTGLPQPVVAAEPESQAPAWRFAEVDATALGLWEGDRPVMVYNHGTRLKPGVPADRARASYVHPLYGLDGEVLTDDFPEDHHHHRGLFWGWPMIGLGDRKVDSWALTGITNRWERWGRRETERRTALLEVENGWYVGQEKVMSEQVRFHIHPATHDSRAIDVEFTWTPGAQPIRLAGAEGKSYGGLTLRYAPGTNTVITTPAGQSPEDLYITRLPWADLSRLFASTTTNPGGNPAPSRTSGAALFIAPDHPDYPPTWLTRHYGVLCIGWPGVDGRTFAPGVPIRCAYRVWIHRHGTAPDKVAAAYESYRAEHTKK